MTIHLKAVFFQVLAFEVPIARLTWKLVQHENHLRQLLRKHTETQGSKLKKSLGRLLATNWRNLVARCKFLVASLYDQKNINFGAG